MAQEKQAHKRSLRSMEEFHAQERDNFRRLAEEEQHRAAAEKAHIAGELKNEYAALMASVAEQRGLEAERLIKREVGLAQSPAYAHWEQVLSERQAGSKAEEEQRRCEPTTRLEERHRLVWSCSRPAWRRTRSCRTRSCAPSRRPAGPPRTSARRASARSSSSGCAPRSSRSAWTSSRRRDA
jgi:hypothetical protein